MSDGMAVLCAGLALVGFGLGPWAPWWAWLLGVVVTAVVGARWSIAFGPAFLALGGLLATAHTPGPVLRGHVALHGQVVGAPVGRQADLDVWACSVNNAPLYACRGRVRVRFVEPVRPRSRWAVHGMAKAPPRSGFGGPSVARSMAAVGARTFVWASGARSFDPQPPLPTTVGSAGVLRAVATGDRSGVSAKQWDILRKTGTSHLLAISGFHVGLVAGLVGGCVRVGCRWWGAIRPEGVWHGWPWWAGALAALAYTWMAGAPVSAQRACGVVVLAALARSWDRQVEPVRLLVTVGTVVVSYDPAALFSPGFQLSFGAVAGLIRLGPMFAKLFPIPIIGRGLAATFSATMGTLPAASFWFQSLSVTSPVANVFAVPWLAVGIAPFAAGDTLLCEPLAWVCREVGGRSIDVLFALLEPLAWAVLHPAVDGVGACALAAIFLRARLVPIGVVLLVVLGLRSSPRDGVEVTFFDVGQGDAALVELSDGRRWLVDGGRRRGLVSELRRRGITRLTGVVASHGDADHARGLETVLCELTVERLHIGRLEGHDALRAAADQCDVPLHVYGTGEGSNNEASVVFRLDSAYGSVLFTGDIEVAQEPFVAGVDVLKVPHHGSKTSTSAMWLDHLFPRLAVVSVGENRYGHPSADVLGRIREARVGLLRTDQDGTVTVRLDAEGLSFYRATGPWIWFSGERLASPKKTTMANPTRRRLMPWL